MNLPRWLTPPFLSKLAELDERFRDERRNGPIVVEIHYAGGQPLLAKVRDVLLAPAMLEVRVMVATTS